MKGKPDQRSRRLWSAAFARLAPWATGATPAKTVFRGGYGWFFDRFQVKNVLQAIRQNGINQQEYVTKNPSLGSSGGSEAAPTTYAIAPNLKAPLSMQAAVGVEHRFGKGVTVSTTGISTRAACTNSIPTTSTHS
jgi:hypothetical protein